MKTLKEIKAESRVETLLRKRERSEEERIFSEIRREREQRQALRHEKAAAVKTPGYFIANQLQKMRSERYLLVRKKRQREEIPNDSRLLVAVKIHNSVHAAAEIKKALRALGLREKLTCVFLRADCSTQELLRTAEPYVAFGEPSTATIEQLIRKRGKVLVKGEELALKDNLIVEEHLGAHGLICIEDLIFEVTHPTENFALVTEFLCPFKLNAPEGTFKKTPFSKGGDCGYRHLGIDALIRALS